MKEMNNFWVGVVVGVALYWGYMKMRASKTA